MKKILKKETNINNEKITICVWFVKMDERLFVGKKPPDEIIVIDKFKELKDLKSNIFKIKKIEIVIPEYKIKILIVCLNTSELLKDKKFVSDFFKLSSYMSIKKIIENKKYKPPIHWIEDLHNIKPWSICFILSKIVKPVDVNPETVSKIEFKKVRL